MAIDKEIVDKAKCAICDILKKKKRSGQARVEDLEIYRILCGDGKNAHGEYTKLEVFWGLTYLKMDKKSDVKVHVDAGRKYYEYAGELDDARFTPL